MAKADLMDYDKAIEMFEPVLGFEVHVELNTQTKMFSDAPNPAAAGNEPHEPNTTITPVDLGLPGSLPVVNEQAIRYSISLGLALGCSIAPSSRFARKNYFRSEEHTSELQSRPHLVCRLLLEKKKKTH